MQALPNEREMLEFVNRTLKSTLEKEPLSGNRFYFRNRYLHTLRVMGWVKRLAPSEKCDLDTTLCASIFHDVGYDSRYKEQHATLGAQICRKYMDEKGFDPDKTERVCALVAQHSQKKRPASELSPDLCVLMDADLLDELGVTTVVWDSLDEGASQGDYYSLLKRVKYAYQKLLPLKNVMKTQTGRAEYEKGLDVLDGCIKRLEYELQAEYVMGFYDDN